MVCVCLLLFFFFQAEDGIRDAQESRGLGDVYKRQPERSEYNNFAVYLVTTVNVDPDLVKSERKALVGLAEEMDRELRASGRRLLYCCGHGPVSVMENGELVPAIKPVVYHHPQN